MSISRTFRPPALMKAFRARSTSAATAAGSGLTGSSPVSIRATSSRSETRAFRWSPCSAIMRANWRTTAGSRSSPPLVMAAADPIMEVRGVLSSWLTMARNSARSRSNSSISAMSCMVTITDSTTSPSTAMGVELSSTVALRPSGTSSTIFSALTVSSALNSWATGFSRRENSRPSARRKLNTSSSSSGLWPGLSRPSAIRSASRLKDLGMPVAASTTTTPTGEVLIRVSRSTRARRSSRCLLALAMAMAAWDANSARVSSSSWENSPPPSL